MLRSGYQNESPLECFRRRILHRYSDKTLAWGAIARARAFNRGQKRLGIVLVSAEDASEENIRAATRRLEVASHNHHHGSR